MAYKESIYVLRMFEPSSRVIICEKGRCTHFTSAVWITYRNVYHAQHTHTHAHTQPFYDYYML